ncbi:DUF998 domain-containing protein [Thermococcus sp. Bubb.Bath]|uniref:DUF998 domain-containing protein n=1 Tax=Thermococcus sp. Bubb.Bath TaxID=1638242 RepID=UPI00143C400A|nr:DUF998 domain-containing protein [Thermococcus sp. Bubb.Bath]NJF24304.1 DUF998 domain-containing protein [Thermococcus sp. Bubb.Bath]
MNVNIIKLGGYVAVFLPLIFVTGLLIVIHRNPWFSFTNNALSDMGSLKNPARWWFNSFLMIYAITTLIPSLAAFKSGLSYLMPAAAIFLFLVGVFPEETGPHTPSAVLFYTLALSDIAIIGLKLWHSGVKFGYLWSILAVTTFLLMMWMIRARVFKGIAIPELVGAATILAWFVYVGLLLLRGFKL